MIYLGILDVAPADTGVGTHVKLTCGCVALYVCGRRRALVGMCWNHAMQRQIAMAIVPNHPALCN